MTEPAFRLFGDWSYKNSNGALVSTSGAVLLIPGILLLLKVPPFTFGAPSYCLHDL